MTTRRPATGRWQPSSSLNPAAPRPHPGQNQHVFNPIHTERLVIRPMTLDDVANIHARRNDPDAARYQDWEVPYSLERAEAWLPMWSGWVGQSPTSGGWRRCVSTTGRWSAISPSTSRGRVAQRRSDTRSNRRHWGRGFATEALTALVDYLFDDAGVTRVWGALDPANPPSARLLERTGFLYRG